MSSLARWRAVLAFEDAFLPVARLTLLTVLVIVHGDRVQLLVTAVVTAMVFLEERRLRSPWPWLTLATVLAVRQWQEWWLVDDHAVLATYWLGALGLSRFGHRPDDVLRSSARLLVAGVFVFAFGWKLLSSQFTSGDFFEYTLVRDPRFEPVAVLAGGVDETRLAAGRAAVDAFTAGGTVTDTVHVSHGPRTETVAAILTAFGLAIEGSVAVVHVLPLRGRTQVLRPVSLLAFCLTTYVVLPIAGFGMLLLAMGMAQSASRRMRSLQAGAALVVLVWGSVLATLVL